MPPQMTPLRRHSLYWQQRGVADANHHRRNFNTIIESDWDGSAGNVAVCENIADVMFSLTRGKLPRHGPSLLASFLT